MKNIVFISILLLGGLASCYYDNSGELNPELTAEGGNCDTTGVMSFNSDIAPILNQNCGTGNSCHGSSNTSGINLSSFNGVNNVATNGKLLSSLVWDGKATQMPQGSSTKMSACSIAKIEKWVAAGHANN